MAPAPRMGGSPGGIAPFMGGSYCSLGGGWRASPGVRVGADSFPRPQRGPAPRVGAGWRAERSRGAGRSGVERCRPAWDSGTEVPAKGGSRRHEVPSGDWNTPILPSSLPASVSLCLLFRPFSPGILGVVGCLAGGGGCRGHGEGTSLHQRGVCADGGDRALRRGGAGLIVRRLSMWRRRGVCGSARFSACRPLRGVFLRLPARPGPPIRHRAR